MIYGKRIRLKGYMSRYPFVNRRGIFLTLKQLKRYRELDKWLNSLKGRIIYNG